MLASALNPDKLNLFDQVGEVMRTTMSEMSMLRGEFTFVTVLTL